METAFMGYSLCSIMSMLRFSISLPALVLFAAFFSPIVAADANFPPLDAWKSAVVSGDNLGLRMLYSTNPAAQIETSHGNATADDDISFWSGLKAKNVKLNVMQASSPQAGMEQVVFQAEVTERLARKAVFISEAQLWLQQGGQWKIVQAKRTELTHLQQPLSLSKNIYPAGVDAKAEIKDALQRANREHKRVLLVFGANWCYDCHVLDLAFQRGDLAPLLVANYEVVHVDVGEGDKNQDLMQLYHVPMGKGIPALAVLDGAGKLLYSQQHGEFEKARALTPEELAAFLTKWKAPRS
ncbi:MAG TPA: thioredoxin family protein [Terriglobales bacterium]|nr:thioredoxin family protein [Terriglobales bacterium]